MGISVGKILGTDKMPGGKVRIISSDKLFETHNEEMKLLKEKGNIANLSFQSLSLGSESLEHTTRRI